MEEYKLNKKEQLKKLREKSIDNVKFSIEHQNSKEDISYRLGKLAGFKQMVKNIEISDINEVIFYNNTILEFIEDKKEEIKGLNKEWYKGFEFALENGLQILKEE